MFEEEEIAKSKRPKTFPRDVSEESVMHMQEYIAELEAEIAKVKKEIGKRGGARAKAEEFFS